MAIGTPGGDMQDQWSLGALLGHLHFGLEPGGMLKAGANPRGMQGYAVGR